MADPAIASPSHVGRIHPADEGPWLTALRLQRVHAQARFWIGKLRSQVACGDLVWFADAALRYRDSLSLPPTIF